MFQVIRNWLNSDREYFTGVALCVQFCNNGKMIALLKSACNDRNKVRLHDIMMQEYTRLKPFEPKESFPLVKKAAAGKFPREFQEDPQEPALVVVTHETSPVYQAAIKEADKAYKQVMSVRAILLDKAKINWDNADDLDPNRPELVAQRSKLAIEVVTGYNRASQLYDKADFVLLNGRLPNDDTLNEEEYASLPDHLVKHEISNIQKNISKLRAREQTPERIALIIKHETNLQKLTEKWRTLN
jgi:hypothetical protein